MIVQRARLWAGGEGGNADCRERSKSRTQVRRTWATRRRPATRAGMSRHHAGFTLLELLVAVGIIALLIAILMPSLANARRNAQRVTCQGQARQLVIGWHQLLDASRGLFPHGATMSITYGGKQGLDGRKQPKPLNKYLSLPEVVSSGAEVFRCPGDREPVDDELGGSSSGGPNCFDYYGTSYKANRLLVGADLPISGADKCGPVLKEINDRIQGLNRSEVYDEPRVILLGDFGWEDAWNVASFNRLEWHGRRGWHNIGFMDGHADFTPIYKGIYVDDRYTVVPFKNLQSKAARLQPPH